MWRERKDAEEQKQREFEEAAETSRRAQEVARKVLIMGFLKDHGYTDVNAPKKTMLKTKYPIHTAAKTGDPKIVAALLEEGADPGQKTSTGQTAAQVAQQKNTESSHANVLRTLGGA